MSQVQIAGSSIDFLVCRVKSLIDEVTGDRLKGLCYFQDVLSCFSRGRDLRSRSRA